jgi:hypothetical protein
MPDTLGSSLSPFGAIGVGIGALGSIGKFLTGNKQNAYADSINPVYTPYQTSEYAKQNLGAVQNMFYGNNPAFDKARQDALKAQSNTLSNAGRNATNSADLLAVAGGSQGQTDAALGNIGSQETQQKYGLLDNLSKAYSQLTDEGRYANEQMLNKYKTDLQAKLGLRTAGLNNQLGGISDLSALGIKLDTPFGNKSNG